LDYTIHSDPSLIEKVFSQLIDNAIKFTTTGSVTVEFQTKDNSIEFFVRDSGIGIGADVQEIIFEKFMQEDVSATRSFEGSGLGLSIIKGILNHLGGTITFESVKGEGTTFYFSLPIHRD
jgi:signal transduction histidine kinase